MKKNKFIRSSTLLLGIIAVLCTTVALKCKTAVLYADEKTDEDPAVPIAEENPTPPKKNDDGQSPPPPPQQSLRDKLIANGWTGTQLDALDSSKFQALHDLDLAVHSELQSMDNANLKKLEGNWDVITKSCALSAMKTWDLTALSSIPRKTLENVMAATDTVVGQVNNNIIDPDKFAAICDKGDWNKMFYDGGGSVIDRVGNVTALNLDLIENSSTDVLAAVSKSTQVDFIDAIKTMDTASFGMLTSPVVDFNTVVSNCNVTPAKIDVLKKIIDWGSHEYEYVFCCKKTAIVLNVVNTKVDYLKFLGDKFDHVDDGLVTKLNLQNENTLKRLCNVPNASFKTIIDHAGFDKFCTSIGGAGAVSNGGTGPSDALSQCFSVFTNSDKLTTVLDNINSDKIKSANLEKSLKTADKIDNTPLVELLKSSNYDKIITAATKDATAIGKIGKVLTVEKLKLFEFLKDEIYAGAIDVNSLYDLIEDVADSDVNQVLKSKNTVDKDLKKKGLKFIFDKATKSNSQQIKDWFVNYAKLADTKYSDLLVCLINGTAGSLNNINKDTIDSMVTNNFNSFPKELLEAIGKAVSEYNIYNDNSGRILLGKLDASKIGIIRKLISEKIAGVEDFLKNALPALLQSGNCWDLLDKIINSNPAITYNGNVSDKLTRFVSAFNDSGVTPTNPKLNDFIVELNKPNALLAAFNSNKMYSANSFKDALGDWLK